MTANTSSDASRRSGMSILRDPSRLAKGVAGRFLPGMMFLMLGFATPSLAGTSPAKAAAQAPAAESEASTDDATNYCNNFANAAADARFARQAAALAALEKQIEQSTAALEAKRAEYQDWLDRREAFIKKADAKTAAIYSQMRPDAAATQMAAMDEFAAAALLANLNPRIAGAILAEMDPAKAAELTNTMAGLGRRNAAKEPSS